LAVKKILEENDEVSNAKESTRVNACTSSVRI